MNHSQNSSEIQELHKLIEKQSERIKYLESENKIKDEIIEQYKLKLFSKKSEKWTEVEEKQSLLFNEIEQLSDDIKKEKSIIVKEHRKSKRKRGKREKIASDIPREETILDLDESEKKCGCGCMLTRLPEPEINEKLKIIPAKFVVLKTIRYKYVCKKCEGSGDEGNSGVKIKPPVSQLIPKGILHQDSLAYMIVQKYCDHLPLYRIVRILERYGVSISRSTLANNFITVADKLENIADEIFKITLAAPAMQIDETRLQVINEPGRKGENISWMWCFRSGLIGELQGSVYFHYDESRSAKLLINSLENYKGIIQTDGLPTYNAYIPLIGEDIHAGCNAHARRKFADIFKATKNNSTVNHVISEYSKIYRLEETYRRLKIAKNKDKLEKRRKKYSFPIMENLKEYLTNKITIIEPSSLVYKAARYFLSEYNKLIKFIFCGDIPPDTNYVENAIRPFAVGRKNWLFCFSPKGAKASAILYTLIENAKICKIDPYKYFLIVFNELIKNPNCNPADLTPQAIAQNLK